MKRIPTCLLTTVALLLLLGAGPAGAEDDQVERLRQRVAELERRMAELEAKLSPVADDPDEAAEQARQHDLRRQRAAARMKQDVAQYTPDQLREIEQTYQIANKNWNTPEAVAALEKLIKEFPKANRTGCAVLYLAQMSEGEKQVTYLRKAIEDYSDCYYGDGVQVGAYARYMLAAIHEANGEQEKAAQLRDELREKFPDAVDHHRRSLNRGKPAPPAAQTQPTAESVAIDAAAASALKWVELIDNGQYARSWDDASKAFREVVTQDQWQTSLRGARSPLGKVVSRKVKSTQFRTTLPGAPDGKYVIMQYDTVFEHKQQAVETITPMLEADGSWRVSGYYIK